MRCRVRRRVRVELLEGGLVPFVFKEESFVFRLTSLLSRDINRPLRVVACLVKCQWGIYPQGLDSEVKRGEQDGKDSTPGNGGDAGSDIPDGTSLPRNSVRLTQEAYC